MKGANDDDNNNNNADGRMATWRTKMLNECIGHRKNSG